MENQQLGKLKKYDLEKILQDKSVDKVLEQISMEEVELYYKDDLLEFLKTTKSTSIRNTCALLLSDLSCAEAIGILIDLILDHSVKSKGTLIYALQNLPISFAELEKLLPVLYQGSFECRMEMKSLIEHHSDLINDNNVVLLLKPLQKTINSYEDSLELFYEVREFLLDSII